MEIPSTYVSLGSITRIHIFAVFRFFCFRGINYSVRHLKSILGDSERLQRHFQVKEKARIQEYTRTRARFSSYSMNLWFSKS